MTVYQTQNAHKVSHYMSPIKSTMLCNDKNTRENLIQRHMNPNKDRHQAAIVPVKLIKLELHITTTFPRKPTSAEPHFGVVVRHTQNHFTANAGLINDVDSVLK